MLKIVKQAFHQKSSAQIAHRLRGALRDQGYPVTDEACKAFASTVQEENLLESEQELEGRIQKLVDQALSLKFDQLQEYSAHPEKLKDLELAVLKDEGPAVFEKLILEKDYMTSRREFSKWQRMLQIDLELEDGPAKVGSKLAEIQHAPLAFALYVKMKQANPLIKSPFSLEDEDAEANEEATEQRRIISDMSELIDCAPPSCTKYLGFLKEDLEEILEIPEASTAGLDNLVSSYMTSLKESPLVFNLTLSCLRELSSTALFSFLRSLVESTAEVDYPGDFALTSKIKQDLILKMDSMSYEQIRKTISFNQAVRVLISADQEAQALVLSKTTAAACSIWTVLTALNSSGEPGLVKIAEELSKDLPSNPRLTRHASPGKSEEELILEDCLRVQKELPLPEKGVLRIEDFLSIERDFNFNQGLVELQSWYSGSHSVEVGQPSATLVLLLFDSIKRREDFSIIVQCFKRKNSRTRISKVVLFNYLLLQADDNLRCLLFISTAQFMAIPISSWNCWGSSVEVRGEEVPGEEDQIFSGGSPKKLENFVLERLHWKENLFVFEKNLSVLNMKMPVDLEDKELPQGATEFANSLFGKTFHSHSPSKIESGCVEMQYDFNCQVTEHTVVADVHGLPPINELPSLALVFDFVIIHVIGRSPNSQGKMKGLLQMISDLRSSNPSLKILVAAHTPSEDNLEVKISEFEFGTSILQLPPFSAGYQDDKAVVLEECLDWLRPFFTASSSDYKRDLHARIEAKRQYLAYLSKVLQMNEDEGLQNLSQVISLSESFATVIRKFDSFQSEEFLPMLQFVKSKLSIDQDLQKQDPPLSDDEEQSLKLTRNDMIARMHTQEATEVTDLFLKVIQTTRTLSTSFFLASLFKGYVEHELIPLFAQKDELRERIQSSSAKKMSSEEQEQLKTVNERIRAKQFSQEMMAREIYYFSAYQAKGSRRDLMKQYFLSYSRQQLAFGQPLELIDGDNLNFVTEIEAIKELELEDSSTLVVSVIGPQSAGKSLLMNFLFGTQFVTSAGRCTKGVYFSVMKFKDQKAKKTRNILLLDTEGIQSAEGRDPLFDRRIVYFIMGISHVVLMCNKGEMNKNMGDVIKLVDDALNQAAFDKVKNPSVFIIMNMMAQINQQTRQDCINQLEDMLIDEKRPSFRIHKDMVFPLQFAFSSETFGPSNARKCINKPSSLFAQSISPLQERILAKFDDIENESTTVLSLQEAFDKMEEFWNFTGNYSSQIDYNTLAEKRQDMKVRAFLKDLQHLLYTQVEDEILQKLESDFEAVVEATENKKFDNLCQKMKTRIEDLLNPILREAESRFDTFCLESSVTFDLKHKRKPLLSKFSEKEFNQHQAYFNKKISEHLEVVSSSVGNQAMNESAEDLLKKKEKYTEEEAAGLFSQHWKASRQRVEEVIPSEQQIRHQSIERVVNQIKSNFKDTYGESFFLTKELIGLIEAQGTKECMKQLKTFLNENAFHEDADRPPAPLQVASFQSQESKFLRRLPPDLVIQKQAHKYFRWTDMLRVPFMRSRAGDYEIVAELMKAFKITGFASKKRMWRDEDPKPNYAGISEKVKEIQRVLDRFNRELEQLQIKFVPPPFTEEEIFAAPPKKMEKRPPPKTVLKWEMNANKIEMRWEKKADRELEAHDRNKYGQIKLVREACSWEQVNSLLRRYLHSWVSDNAHYSFAKCPQFLQQQARFHYLALDQRMHKDLLDRAIVLSEVELKEPGLAKISYSSTCLLNNVHEDFFISNRNLEEYLNYLLQPRKGRLSSSQVKSAKACFVQLVSWERVAKAILRIIMVNCTKNMQSKRDNFNFLEVLATPGPESRAKEGEFVEINDSIFNAIFNELEYLFHFFDEEIQPFKLKISTNGQSAMLHFAAAVLIKLTELLMCIRLRAPLLQYDSTKEREKALFIAKLTCNDSDVDGQLAHRIGYDTLLYFKSLAKKQVEKQFQQHVKGRKDDFKKVFKAQAQETTIYEIALQVHKHKDVGKKYKLSESEQKAVNEYLKFFDDPTKFLEKKFAEEFHLLTSQVKAQCQVDYKSHFSNRVQGLCRFLEAFLTGIKTREANKSAVDLFRLSEHFDNASLLSTDDAKSAVVQYFKLMLLGLWKPGDSISLPEETYGEGELEIVEKIPLPSVDMIKIELAREDRTKITALLLDSDKISNLSSFLEHLIAFFNQNASISKFKKEMSPNQEQTDSPDGETPA